MPDLMTHFTASYLLKRAVAPKENMTAFLLGAALPDILAYIPLVVAGYIPSGSLPAWIKDLPFMFLAFHSVIGFFLFSWWAALLFHVDLRRGVFVNLFLGGLLHFCMDMFQVQHAEFSSFLLPFSWQSFHLGWFGTEASLWGLPFITAAAVIVYSIDILRRKVRRGTKETKGRLKA